MKLNYTSTYSFCQHDINWIAYYKYYEKYGLLPYDKNFEIIDVWYDLACSCGWCYTFENIVFVCEKPSKLYLNAQGQLHKDGDMALKYSDGYGLWMLNGVQVPKELVTTKAEELNPEIILKEQNAEIRREIVRKIGIERICQKLNAKILSKSPNNMYELLELQIQGNDYQYLKMKNPSIGTYHIEGVRGCQTWKDALEYRKPAEMKKIPQSENGQDWFQQGDVCIWPRNAKFLKPLPTILT